ncbi:hypothetical protein C5167_020537 [Papaver somniferum]|uniref:Uncharacterized protein n=1 Tax=Papaver somniferum TaxID=3469 RepID=A0A4Y7IXI6_PAPSO|nr:hypothetical protein C5167_020537 [Papaver somniferum]
MNELLQRKKPNQQCLSLRLYSMTHPIRNTFIPPVQHSGGFFEESFGNRVVGVLHQPDINDRWNMAFQAGVRLIDEGQAFVVIVHYAADLMSYLGSRML